MHIVGVLMAQLNVEDAGFLDEVQLLSLHLCQIKILLLFKRQILGRKYEKSCIIAQNSIGLISLADPDKFF